ncbi:MAG: hypothetical protein ACK4PR_07730 [Gammaproteobacteria bacterium]
MNQNKKVFVAYLDILGYGAFVEENAPNIVIQMNNNFSLQAQIALAYASVAKHNKTGDLKKKPYKRRQTEDGRQVVIPDLDNTKINSLMMFDSIVFWTADDKDEDFHDLLNVVTIFLQGQFAMGFPARGAIAFGEFYFSGGSIQSSSVTQHYILASKAQVSAQRLEANQLWSGCVLHESVLERCKELSITLTELENLKRIIKYPVPFKRQYELSGSRDMYALVWLGHSEQWFPERKVLDINMVVKKAFSLHGKKIGKKEEEKINNTIKFVNYVFPIKNK